MAQYEHLSIYRDAFQFCLYCESVVKNFSRYHKYTHGTKLRDLAREMLLLIIRAQNSEDKLPALDELRLRVEETKVVLRLCQELRAFANFAAVDTAFDHVLTIARQTEGWRRSLRRPEGGQKPRSDGN